MYFSFIPTLALALRLHVHIRSLIYENPVETEEDLVTIILALY